jgi:hypothetical protein
MSPSSHSRQIDACVMAVSFHLIALTRKGYDGTFVPMDTPPPALKFQCTNTFS